MTCFKIHNGGGKGLTPFKPFTVHRTIPNMSVKRNIGQSFRLNSCWRRQRMYGVYARKLHTDHFVLGVITFCTACVIPEGRGSSVWPLKLFSLVAPWAVVAVPPVEVWLSGWRTLIFSDIVYMLYIFHKGRWLALILNKSYRFIVPTWNKVFLLLLWHSWRTFYARTYTGAHVHRIIHMK